MQTVPRHYTDFSGGLDTRQGVIAEDPRRFAELVNCVATPGKKVERRKPLIRVPGLIDVANTKGFVRLDGKWYAFAPKGTVPAHTIDGGVTTLFFDLPDYCTTTGWNIVDAGIYGTVPFAVIRHDYPGGAVTNIIKLHLWDSRPNKPTYVEDPACPTSWGPELPQHIYGTGTTGAFLDYTPAVTVASNKIHMSRPDANVAFCKINDARVWNSRTVDQVLTLGDLYYFIQPDDPSGLYQFTVSLPFNELAQDGRWAAYVCELMLTDGSWIQLDETSFLPVALNSYRPIPLTSRFGGVDEIGLQVRMANIPGRILRFRAIAKAAPLTILSGGRFDPGNPGGPVINDAKVQHQGASFDAPKTTITIPPLSAGKTFLVGVPLAGSGVPAAREVTLPGTMPYNGLERYRIRLIAKAIVHGGGTYFVSALTGTVAIASLSNVVNGTGTAFTTELIVGDRVLINGEERQVSAIENDTAFSVTNVFTTTASGVPALRRQTYDYASDIAAGNQWYAQKEVEAVLRLAGVGQASFINTSFHDNSGKPPTLLAQVKNRLGVFYDGMFQLWQTDPIPTGYAFLDSIAVGTGRNVRTKAAEVNGDMLVPTDTGPRAFNATGLNYDAAEDQNLGEILDGTLLPPITAAGWWPYKNLYVAAGAQDGVLTVVALTVIRSARINAWSTFTFQGVSNIDDVWSEGERFYIRDNDKLYYLDGTSEDYKDSNDPDSLPFESKGRWHFMHFGFPNRNKRMTNMDVVQTGPAHWRWYPNPYLPAEVLGPIFLSNGPSWGRTRVPLACMGAAIAFEFASRSRSGYRLEALLLEMQPLRR